MLQLITCSTDSATARFIARVQLGRVKRQLISLGLLNKHARSFPPCLARQLERTLRRRGPLSGPLVFSRVGPSQNNGRMTRLQNVGKSTAAGRNTCEGPPKARLVITALPAARPIANGLGALRLLSVLAARELPRGFFLCSQVGRNAACRPICNHYTVFSPRGLDGGGVVTGNVASQTAAFREALTSGSACTLTRAWLQAVQSAV